MGGVKKETGVYCSDCVYLAITGMKLMECHHRDNLFLRKKSLWYKKEYDCQLYTPKKKEYKP